MKGQEEVLSIIMLVMIALAVVSLAYMWITGMFSSLADTISNAIKQTTSSMATQFRLENAVYDPVLNESYVTIRNVGTQDFDATRTAFYVNEISQTPEIPSCPNCDCNSLSKGCIASYEILNVVGTVSEGSTLRITIETGAQDSRKITIISPSP